MCPSLPLSLAVTVYGFVPFTFFRYIPNNEKYDWPVFEVSAFPGCASSVYCFLVSNK